MYKSRTWASLSSRMLSNSNETTTTRWHGAIVVGFSLLSSFPAVNGTPFLEECIPFQGFDFPI